MKRAHIAIACLLGAGLVTGLAWAQDSTLPSVKELTSHIDSLYQADASHGRMTMAITTKHFSRTLELEMWSLGKEMNLAVIRKPAREAGTATLKTDEGLWNYAPRADRLMRIPPGLLSEGWMGSHFTNDDLMKQNRYETDYDTTVAWADHAGARVIRLTMIPKRSAAVVYTRIDFDLTAEGWLPLRAVFYDGGDAVRTDAFKAVKAFGERRVPSVIQVTPHDKPGESTTVTYTSLTFGASVSKSLFTPRGLRRAAQQR